MKTAKQFVKTWRKGASVDTRVTVEPSVTFTTEGKSYGPVREMRQMRKATVIEIAARYGCVVPKDWRRRR